MAYDRNNEDTRVAYLATGEASRRWRRCQARVVSTSKFRHICSRYVLDVKPSLFENFKCRNTAAGGSQIRNHQDERVLSGADAKRRAAFRSRSCGRAI